MDINWRAVLYGFLVTIALGLLSGVGIPYTNASLPVLGWGLTGLVGGLVGGYVAGGTLGNGAVNGGLASVLGAFIALVVLSVLGVLFGGLLGIGIFTVGLLFLVSAAIPGGVGGAIGSWAKGRAERSAEMGRPAA